MNDLAVVPKDPRKLLSMDNAVVVTKDKRRELIVEFARPEKRPKFKKTCKSLFKIPERALIAPEREIISEKRINFEN